MDTRFTKTGSKSCGRHTWVGWARVYALRRILNCKIDHPALTVIHHNSPMLENLRFHRHHNFHCQIKYVYENLLNYLFYLSIFHLIFLCTCGGESLGNVSESMIREAPRHQICSFFEHCSNGR